jgi:hypothetical protein
MATLALFCFQLCLEEDFGVPREQRAPNYYRSGDSTIKHCSLPDV